MAVDLPHEELNSLGRKLLDAFPHASVHLSEPPEWAALREGASMPDFSREVFDSIEPLEPHATAEQTDQLIGVMRGVLDHLKKADEAADKHHRDQMRAIVAFGVLGVLVAMVGILVTLA